MSETTLPGPDQAVLHVHTEAGQLGPFSRRQLAEEVAAKRVSPQAHVWFAGLAEWQPMDRVQGLLSGLDVSEDDRLDGVFGQLVKASWDYLGDHSFSSHIDEVLLGAVITACLDNGYSLIDLNSDGSHHYVRFEDFSDKSRLLLRLTHLTPGLATAKVLGQRASVVVGYGERSGNISKILAAIRAEMQSGFLQNAEPGTLTIDGDVVSGYVYAQVDLYLNIDDYIARDYTINYASLTSHLNACRHALRKYLRGRFA
jgi:hypothetical protein